MGYVIDVGHAALDLVLPRACAGCGAPGGVLCPRCRSALAGTPYPAWPCPRPPGLPAPWAVAPYGGVARAAIVAYKDRTRWPLARPLGEALARAVAGTGVPGGAPGNAIVLVPVPSRRTASRRRGRDPVAALAVAAAAALRRHGVATGVLAALRHTRRVSDQAGLAAEARRANLAGAVTVARGMRRSVGGRSVVVVDDVITTGATLAEASRALRAAHVHVAAAAVVAATPRRGRGTAGTPLHKPGFSG